ncbi:L-lactate dehydrogenase-like [Coccinella septempunctata]|uniref:L-lactate dehydrogenase-like n=1 Tax=Coccinella septempunctata TaxID=41139 RepID=UPI001D0836D6|nr:L-lactate dehydrogenase-like [Coccinella septempunctata]
MRPLLLKLSSLLRYAGKETRKKFCTKIVEPALFTEVSEAVEDTENKVTVVGAGKLGVACAFALLTQGVSHSVVLVDKNEGLLKGETLDMRHGSLFLKTGKIQSSTTFKKSANSRITIVTAGFRRQSSSETRFSLVQKNVEIFKEIIPEVVKYSPNTIMMIVTNPVDIMAWVAWKLSRLPLSRVIGSGTNIDSVRLRILISERFGIPAYNCRAYVIGEHEKNLIPIWSTANVEGVKLRELNPRAAKEGDPEDWKKVQQIVVDSPQEILKLKGSVSWAPALGVVELVDNIIRNTNSIRTVSTNVKGYHGVNFEVFLSLPCVLNANGIHKIVKQPFEKDESEKFLSTAKIHRTYMDSIDLSK